MPNDSLKQLLHSAIVESVNSCVSRYGAQNLLGYAVISHDTADSAYFAVATEQERTSFEYGANNYLYAPENWSGEPEQDTFAAVNQELAHLYDSGDYETNENWHTEHRKMLFEAAIGVLSELVNKRLFTLGEAPKDVFVAFSLTDSSTSETHLPLWVQTLNSASVYKGFMNWKNEA